MTSTDQRQKEEEVEKSSVCWTPLSRETNGEECDERSPSRVLGACLKFNSRRRD
ncbi:MAG: hypothetical protein ACK56I_20335 [bacterium]